ncbi:MAG: thiamine-phosphate kinase [Candidatus Bathyarchaeota archaeon]|nr:thiamine-phosphate kinase [Candidatus Bathyarchaeota archaeon]
MDKHSAKGAGRVTSKDLGEHKIIEIIKSKLSPMPNMPVPFGDDVSAVSLDPQTVAVLKTDMLVGKTDVPKHMSLWQAARKALIMNISDFASKGVQPTAALVSLGLPRNLLTKDIEELASGLNSGAQEYDAYIIGGDTNEASDLVIAISLFGTAQKSNLMLRSGAKPGDILAVTGFFGKSAAGLRLLLDEQCQTSHNLRDVLLGAVCMPKARLAEGLALSRSGGVSASIDSSDGLAWSLHEIARLSNVGFLVDSIPVADEVRRFAEFNRLDAVELALHGGEEYELVVTVKPKNWVDAETAVEAVGSCLLPIGKVTRETDVVLNVDGKKCPIEDRGWEHFKTKI